MRFVSKSEQLSLLLGEQKALLPAVIKTKDAHKYVGGQPTWVQLHEEYDDVLLPIRKTPRGDQLWLVEVIDHVLKMAQAEGKLRGAA